MFGLAFQIAAFCAVFALCTYVFIIADPETSDVARFCTQTIPNAILVQLGRILGDTRVAALVKLVDHALQIIYLIVVLGSWSIMFTYGFPEIENSNYVRNYHQYAGYVVFVVCMGSWHYACGVRPGTITKTTIPLFDHYDYDDLLFSNKLCPTLKIRKLARSKYDRFSRKHVPRFDHYCGWLGQSVGEQNYRWFLIFLGVHVFMCTYGAVVMGLVFYGEIREKDLLNATFFNALTGVEIKADYTIVVHYMFMKHFHVCSVLILMTVMGSVLASFLAFHLYITARNMTTNEFFKWREVQKWHKAAKKKYDTAVKEGVIPEQNGSGVNRSGAGMAEALPDTDVNCTGPVASTPSATTDSTDTDEIFDPGPAPKNIYDKGIIGNFSEVFSPYSFRKDAIQRFHLSLQKDEKVIYEEESNKSKKPKSI